MKIHFVTLLARQVEGEYFNLQILNVFTDLAKLREYVKKLEIPRAQVIDGVQCLLEIGVYEDVEVTE